MRDAEVRFAQCDGHAIAYQVFGSGPNDVLVQQAWCPIDLMWELPQLASFMETLGSKARVIVFDSLGSGASDSVIDRRAARVETFSDSYLALLDAARSPRVVLLDTTFGGTSLMFAATYPERVEALIVVNLRPSFPELRHLTTEQRSQLSSLLHSERGLELQNPRLAHDPALRRWWGRARRLLMSSEDARFTLDFAAAMDIAAVLPSVRVPTLVLHRSDNALFDLDTSRATARLIPDAEFVELPGSECEIFLGDTGSAFDEIERFLSLPEPDRIFDRPVASVLFTDMVESTRELVARGDTGWRHLLDQYDASAADVVAQHRGRLIKTLGDGLLATFDGPARAVRCAAALLEAAQRRGITMRAGLHTGEIELRGADIAGIAVVIASRISALAAPNEVLVSRTVVDLTAGSGLQFEPRGERELKGVPGSWTTFALNESGAASTQP